MKIMQKIKVHGRACQHCDHEMKTSLKFYISAYVKINLDGGKYIAEHFQSKATLLTKAEIIEEEVKSHCNIVHDKIEEYYKRRTLVKL